MQKLSLISVLTLLAIGSVGGIITLTMNPFNTTNHASSPQLSTPQMNSITSTLNVNPSSSSTSTASQSSTSGSSGLLTNSTGLLTSAPSSHSGGDDGSGDDGSSQCGVTTQTSITTVTTCSVSHDN